MKSMNKTKRVSIPFLFAFALLWLVLASPVAAEPNLVASIVFGPEVTTPTNTLIVGDTFTATVHTTSASNQSVNAWGMYLNFDPAILQVNSVTRLYPITGSDFCPVPLSFNNTTGRIIGECADLGGGTTTNELDVLEITFEVLETKTRFDVTFDMICDGAGNSECFQAVNGGANQITTYINASNVPLAVSMQMSQIADSTPSLPIFMIVLLSGLALITAIIIGQ